jgi:hypothetical protein
LAYYPYPHYKIVLLPSKSILIYVHLLSAAAAAPTQPVQQPVQQVQPNTNQNPNGLSAAALFSLKNVPWGWVAILIILVLFATVVYLIFNRPKI